MPVAPTVSVSTVKTSVRGDVSDGSPSHRPNELHNMIATAPPQQSPLEQCLGVPSSDTEKRRSDRCRDRTTENAPDYPYQPNFPPIQRFESFFQANFMPINGLQALCGLVHLMPEAGNGDDVVCRATCACR